MGGRGGVIGGWVGKVSKEKKLGWGWEENNVPKNN
jgi:hypothetical protein